ncbi:MAG: helix-turn-helix domain-containing protein [Candidatus Bathyarchaeia archaeon]
MKKELYSIQELASLLGKSPGAVRQLIYRGHLPARRLGRTLYVSREDLEKALKPVGGKQRKEEGGLATQEQQEQKEQKEVSYE